MDDLYYALDKNNEVIPVRDVLQWSKLFEDKSRKVDRTEIGEYVISTVFLGINHSFNPNSEPQVFETMVFHPAKSDYLDLFCERYATWDEAMEGHKLAVKGVEEFINEQKEEEDHRT